jgi:hypothetical protein
MLPRKTTIGEDRKKGVEKFCSGVDIKSSAAMLQSKCEYPNVLEVLELLIHN